MSAEDNKKAFRLRIEAVNECDFDAMDDLISPNYVAYWWHHGDKVVDKGLQEFKDRITHAFEIYPDMRLTIDEIIAEGDIVMAHVTWTGTHKGQSPGRPAPDNKKWGAGWSYWTRWENGKLVEERLIMGQWQHV